LRRTPLPFAAEESPRAATEPDECRKLLPLRDAGRDPELCSGVLPDDVLGTDPELCRGLFTDGEDFSPV
jgi:hypothetical protein